MWNIRGNNLNTLMQNVQSTFFWVEITSAHVLSYSGTVLLFVKSMEKNLVSSGDQLWYIYGIWSHPQQEKLG